MMGGAERQTAVYLRGISGIRPKVPADATQLEAKAKKAMSRQAFAYVKAGAGASHTIDNNIAGFAKWRIVPRMLRDVSGARRECRALWPHARLSLVALPDRRPRARA